MIALFILVPALVATLVTVVMIGVLGAPPVSSRRKEADAVVALLQPYAPRRISDLGAGWGALVLRLSEAFPDAEVVGYELSPLPWLVATLRCARRKHAHIRFADFRRADLTRAGAVVCYLARAPMQALAPLFDRALTPGTPVVSVCFLFRGRRPTAQTRATGLGGDVALYRWNEP